jgi:hypothetical protein
MERFAIKEAPVAGAQLGEHRLGTVVQAAARSLPVIVD